CAIDSVCETTELTALLNELAAWSTLDEWPWVYPWEFPLPSTTVCDSVIVTVVPSDLLVARLQLWPRARECVSVSTRVTPFACEKPMDLLWPIEIVLENPTLSPSASEIDRVTLRLTVSAHDTDEVSETCTSSRFSR